MTNSKSYLKHQYFRRGFTLVEMLVVVAIIVILLAITIPVLSFARRAATRMAGQSQLTALEAACNHYNSDLNQFPQMIGTACWPAYYCQNPSNASQQWVGAGVTQTENLVLALLGGIVPNRSAGYSNTRTVGQSYPFIGANYNKPIWQRDDPMGYDPFAVGKGPLAGPSGTLPPLRQLDCYYKYKADELQDFDGNGLYEFRDKSSLGMPIVYFSCMIPNDGDLTRQNGPKYFNGPDGRGGSSDVPNYKIYDPRHPEVAPVMDNERNAIVHYLKGVYGYPSQYVDMSRRWQIYVRTWPGSGADSNGSILSGGYPNPSGVILISAGPDGIFGPDPKTTVTSMGLQLNVNNVADQRIIRQKVVDCDDVTNWVRQ